MESAPMTLPIIVLRRVEQDPAVREIMNRMDFLQCELGSSTHGNGNEVTGVEAETVSHITDEEDQEPMTIPEIKTEPTDCRCFVEGAAGSCIETCETCDVCEEMGVKSEETVDTDGEIPEAISFPPTIKTEVESSTDSLHLLQGSSGESGREGEKYIAVKEEGYIAVDEEADMRIKEEETPEEIRFPDIKAEPDESCTDSLHILPGSSSESHATPCNSACNFSNIEVEEDVGVIGEGFVAVNEDVDVGIRQAEIAEDTFPDTNAEPGEAAFSGTLSEQGAVKQHQGTHTVERTYRCDVCDRTFSKRSNLKVHQHVHTGQRPYRCDVCNKTFKRQQHLKNHQSVHSGERPYCCDVCKETFSSKSVLIRHLPSCSNQQS